MKSSTSKPDREWEVKFSSDGSDWQAKFRDVSRKRKMTLDLNDLHVCNNEIIQLISIGQDFAAFWHTSSNANFIDQIIGAGHPSQGDPKDDPKKWRGLRILGSRNSQNYLIRFQVKINKTTRDDSCRSFMQLNYPSPPPSTGRQMKRKAEDNDDGRQHPSKVPSSAMIIRITVEVR